MKSEAPLKEHKVTPYPAVEHKSFYSVTNGPIGKHLHITKKRKRSSPSPPMHSPPRKPLKLDGLPGQAQPQPPAPSVPLGSLSNSLSQPNPVSSAPPARRSLLDWDSFISIPKKKRRLTLQPKSNSSPPSNLSPSSRTAEYCSYSPSQVTAGNDTVRISSNDAKPPTENLTHIANYLHSNPVMGPNQATKKSTVRSSTSSETASPYRKRLTEISCSGVDRDWGKLFDEVNQPEINSVDEQTTSRVSPRESEDSSSIIVRQTPVLEDFSDLEGSICSEGTRRKPSLTSANAIDSRVHKESTTSTGVPETPLVTSQHQKKEPRSSNVVDRNDTRSKTRHLSPNCAKENMNSILLSTEVPNCLSHQNDSTFPDSNTANNPPPKPITEGIPILGVTSEDSIPLSQNSPRRKSKRACVHARRQSNIDRAASVGHAAVKTDKYMDSSPFDTVASREVQSSIPSVTAVSSLNKVSELSDCILDGETNVTAGTGSLVHLLNRRASERRTAANLVVSESEISDSVTVKTVVQHDSTLDNPIKDIEASVKEMTSVKHDSEASPVSQSSTRNAEGERDAVVKNSESPVQSEAEHVFSRDRVVSESVVDKSLIEKTVDRVLEESVTDVDTSVRDAVAVTPCSETPLWTGADDESSDSVILISREALRPRKSTSPNPCPHCALSFTTPVGLKLHLRYCKLVPSLGLDQKSSPVSQSSTRNAEGERDAVVKNSESPVQSEAEHVFSRDRVVSESVVDKSLIEKTVDRVLEESVTDVDTSVRDAVAVTPCSEVSLPPANAVSNVSSSIVHDEKDVLEGADSLSHPIRRRASERFTAKYLVSQSRVSDSTDTEAKRVLRTDSVLEQTIDSSTSFITGSLELIPQHSSLSPRHCPRCATEFSTPVELKVHLRHCKRSLARCESAVRSGDDAAASESEVSDSLTDKTVEQVLRLDSVSEKTAEDLETLVEETTSMERDSETPELTNNPSALTSDHRPPNSVRCPHCAGQFSTPLGLKIHLYHCKLVPSSRRVSERRRHVHSSSSQTHVVNPNGVYRFRPRTVSEPRSAVSQKLQIVRDETVLSTVSNQYPPKRPRGRPRTRTLPLSQPSNYASSTSSASPLSRPSQSITSEVSRPSLRSRIRLPTRLRSSNRRSSSIASSRLSEDTIISSVPRSSRSCRSRDSRTSSVDDARSMVSDATTLPAVRPVSTKRPQSTDSRENPLFCAWCCKSNFITAKQWSAHRLICAARPKPAWSQTKRTAHLKGSTPSAPVGSESKNNPGKICLSIRLQTCNACGKKFRSQNALNGHMVGKCGANGGSRRGRPVSSTGTKTSTSNAPITDEVVCPGCPKSAPSFDSFEAFFKHFLSLKPGYHSSAASRLLGWPTPLSVPNLGFGCYICGLLLASESRLDKHKREVHEIWLRKEQEQAISPKKNPPTTE
ncbi:unnamed protein product [Echinostoma caproni]|uniref:C2H2-type domain-containing protein n=1 Tax=Echinostoma caproni TaxID=27848 RepID=A0A183AG13_9TREM|nr:unnamed protein product [Echinostoma caproni]